MNELEKQELMHTCYLMSDMFDSYVNTEHITNNIKDRKMLAKISSISIDLGYLYSIVADIKTTDGEQNESDNQS
jgi:hypothetical protein